MQSLIIIPTEVSPKWDMEELQEICGCNFSHAKQRLKLWLLAISEALPRREITQMNRSRQ